MDSSITSTEKTQGASTHPFRLGSLYAHQFTDWMCILCGLEQLDDDLYIVGFMRLHDQRTFYATFTALEWCEHWARIA